MKRKILGFLLAGALLISVPVQATFADTLDASKLNKVIIIHKEHWASEAMLKLSERDALIFEDETLGYDVTIKKSEFAMILCRALDIQINYLIKPDIKDYFDDVDENAPYASYVINLVTANVFEAGGNFNPDDSLSREEMIYYLMKAYKFKMGEDYTMKMFEESNFADADKITSEYSDAISEAKHHKIIIGNGNNDFNPKKSASRAEFATALVRVSDFLSSKNIQIEVKPEAIVKENSIEMKIIVKNNSEEDICIEFHSGQRFEFQLLDADKNVLWTWSANKMFIQVLSTLELKAGETVEFSDTISEDEYSEIKDKIVYFRAYITGGSSFINRQGYEVELSR
jgi:hypothetical protein